MLANNYYYINQQGNKLLVFFLFHLNTVEEGKFVYYIANSCYYAPAFVHTKILIETTSAICY